MTKPRLARLLALTLAATLAGCGKEAPPAEPAASAPMAAEGVLPPHPLPTAPAAAVDLSGIAKADGGKTVAEIYAEKDALGGQPVTFRGKVVKANTNIMDRHWLHVRDGSGAEGSNDLTVTTTGAMPAVGDTVLVTGTVALDKDFGMGYTYGVLIEDATVQVERPAAQ